MEHNPIKSQTVYLDTSTLSFSKTSHDLCQVECVLWGDLSKPLIVLMGGISASKWALDCAEANRLGWWNQVVNQQNFLNPYDFCFLTFDYFSFPENVNNPPVVSTRYQASILVQIQSQLGLPKFHTVIGSSYGGMVSLALAADYPNSLSRLICIAAADVNSVKSQALRWIQRQIIQLGMKSGQTPEAYTALARSLAMIGYRGENEMEQRFQSKQAGQALKDVEAYLIHHGKQFTEHFLPSRYFQLSRSIDWHQVDISKISAKTLLIGISSDQMVPLDLMKSLYQNLSAECHISIIDSIHGHDGFLLEDQQLNQLFQNFLSESHHDNIIEPNHRCASGHRL